MRCDDVRCYELSAEVSVWDVDMAEILWEENGVMKDKKNQSDKKRLRWSLDILHSYP